MVGRPHRPQMELAHLIAQLLTKEEFLACYACAWIGQAYDALGAEDLTPDEKDVAFESIANQLIFGIRSLGLAGYKFANLDVNEAGVPVPKDVYERTPGNLSYVAVLATGAGKFNYLKAVDALSEIVSGYGLPLDKRAIKTARSEIIESLDAMRKDMTQEDAKEMILEKRRRMEIARSILNRDVN